MNKDKIKLPDLLVFIELLKDDSFVFANNTIKEIIQSFDFDVINNYQEEISSQINLNIKNSKIIVINQINLFDQSQNKNIIYSILAFEKNLLILNENDTNKFLSDNTYISVLFLDKIGQISEISNEIRNDSTFSTENDNLKREFTIKEPNKTFKKIWQLISPCITGYLIKKAYEKTKKDRFLNQNQDSEKITIYKKDFVVLRNLGFGSFFNVDLIYHLERCELMAIKTQHILDDNIDKLQNRERENYMKLKHPLLPKFYNSPKGENYLVMEFINGQTLDNIDKLHLNDKEVVTIIFELILIVEYLHSNNMIYRDLKPNNIIIDDYKNVVLIDFDRLIENDPSEEQSKDFGTSFTDPNVQSEPFSEKSDIYSLGKIIEVINDKKMLECDSSSKQRILDIIRYCDNLKSDVIIPTLQLFIFFVESFYPMIQTKHLPDIFKQIFSKYKNPLCNPYIQMKIGKMYYSIHKNYQNISFLEEAIQFFILAANQNIPQAQYFLGFVYHEGKHISRDVSKSIHYFTLAADQNMPEAQYNLGAIYIEGRYISRDISQAIHYFTLAADNNISEAQYNLGVIYSEGKCISQDIDKAIHYYSLAANQNHLQAQYNLGAIYYEGKYISRDISKAIHYFTQAANQNHPGAQNDLGAIYLEGKYMSRDIKKAIYYFTQAANQNHPQAQYNLGDIYYEGKYISADINKAIHYFKLAADRNISQAQYNLGVIYFEGKYISPDINNMIHYFTLAADQNHPEAQYFLGFIYSEGIYVSRNINKAIHYLTLASNQNHTGAQYNLSVIYSEGRFISPDINKAIHYLTLAADQSFPQAQYILGVIYYEGEYISRDINKAIHYLTLAANQHHQEALNILGVIYSEGKYISRDISKAIHYYSLSANQNHSQAQYNLGVIYYEGKYISRDINKAIHYFTKAANQNHPGAQYNLGFIYIEGKHISRDINKAIRYFTQAANQNHPGAQYNLGVIYSEGIHISRDINKAIHYYSLTASQNIPQAQYNLGVIYYEGKYISRDINKAIHYLTLSANQNHPEAQYILGDLYYEGKYIPQNINKAIHYYSLAANQNIAQAQLILGLMYFEGINISKDIKKGIYLINLASVNHYYVAHFYVGYFYHKGDYIKKDIRKAIRYYKEGSSFNDQYAKNNLAIIYKNGYKDEIQANIENAIVYLKEAIRQKNDILSMYNLANIYLYDKDHEKNIDEAIELLFNSSDQFYHSYILLCLALVKKFGFKIDEIEKHVAELGSKQSKATLSSMSSDLHFLQLNDNFSIYHELYRDKYFLYNHLYEIDPISDFQKQERSNANHISIPVINSVFYEGFGIEI